LKKKKEVALMVQARLSSQRCPGKMTRKFHDTTLMDILLEKLVSSNIPNENIYCSVYEEELLEKVKQYPVNIFRRSEKSANSEGDPITEIFEWWDKIPFKNIVMVSACCPFLNTSTIERFYSDYLSTDKNGMFAVLEKKNYFWQEDGKLLTPFSENMNTKSAAPVREAAHCLYAGSIEDIGNDIWMGDLTKQGDVKLWTMEEKEALDVDYEWQFELCESLYKKKKDEER
jgi:CMP-N-acetylneuraminic acid synthetase